MVKIDKKFTFFIALWVIFYFLVFGFLLKNSFGYLDPDLGWHLKVGEAISLTGVLPHINLYNYSFTGRWVDHEWLANLISFEIYNHAGYLALSAFFAAIITGSLILLNFFIRKFFVKTPDGLLLFFQLFGLLACSPSFGVRMQEFSFLFLLLEFWIIKEFNDKGSSRILLWLLPLFYLWSNMHGSFLFGLGILLFWLVAKLIERWLLSSPWRDYFSDKNKVKLSALKFFAFFSGLALLITLATPYGPELYSFLGSYANTFYLSAIQEWLSQFTPPFLYWQLAYLILLLLILGPYLYNVFYKKGVKIEVWQLGLVVLFLFLAFRSRRNFPLMFLATFPFLLENMHVLFTVNKEKTFFLRKELKYFLLVCLSLTAIGQFFSIRPVVDPFSSYCSKYPCSAVKFLKAESQYKDLRIFNDYNWGGYLIWAYPEKKLFIDGRLPQTAFAGHTLLEEYYEFFKQGTDYESKFAQYNIRLVLIKTKDDKINLQNWEKFIWQLSDKDVTFTNYLRLYLESSDKWQKIYSDPLASVYLKIK
jgi:hypothetical protein